MHFEPCSDCHFRDIESFTLWPYSVPHSVQRGVPVLLREHYMALTYARVTCCTCVSRARAAPEMLIVGGVTTMSTASINYDLLACVIFQHVIWFMGRTWHVLHMCISQFPHFSGFWECHHRNTMKFCIWGYKVWLWVFSVGWNRFCGTVLIVAGRQSTIHAASWSRWSHRATARTQAYGSSFLEYWRCWHIAIKLWPEIVCPTTAGGLAPRAATGSRVSLWVIVIMSSHVCMYVCM